MSDCCSSKKNSENATGQSQCKSKDSGAVNSTASACASETKAEGNGENKAVSSCCGSQATTVSSQNDSCCGLAAKQKIDWIMWGSTIFVVTMYAVYLFMAPSSHHGESSAQLPAWLITMSDTSFEMFNAMWWGIVLGVVLVGWLNRIPREMVIRILGPGHTKRGLFRATLAGLMLDLCNHGILMVAMKLYERGASLGQVMAFLIASPWNSFTLTLILIGLIGLPLTLGFIAFSMVIAWLSGFIFDKLEMNGTLPANPNKITLPEDYQFGSAVKTLSKHADYSVKASLNMLWDGVKGARSVIRWIMFGVVLVALIRAFVPMDIFSTWFGATVSGLFLTLLAATIIEVCSEGSTPIAADLVNRAGAPGNGFTFLMAGAATDYTEIMAIKDTMSSWKIALFLPMITVPQVLMIGWLLNVYGQ